MLIDKQLLLPGAHSYLNFNYILYCYMLYIQHTRTNTMQSRFRIGSNVRTKWERIKIEQKDVLAEGIEDNTREL